MEIGATFGNVLGFTPHHHSRCFLSAASPVASAPSMALYSRFVVVLLYGWSYLCVGYCAMLKTDVLPERRRLDFTHSADKSEAVRDDQDLLLQDTMTEHMQMLYAKYNQAGFPFKDGNTVRSFKAHWGRYPKLLGACQS